MQQFTIDKIWKQPKCPSTGEKEKEYTKYIHKGTLFTMTRGKSCQLGQHGWT